MKLLTRFACMLILSLMNSSCSLIINSFRGRGDLINLTIVNSTDASIVIVANLDGNQSHSISSNDKFILENQFDGSGYVVIKVIRNGITTQCSWLPQHEQFYFFDYFMLLEITNTDIIPTGDGDKQWNFL